MKLHIINTGSVGNSYVLESKSGEMLLIDAGVNFKEIQQTIKFNYTRVVGCLLTHEHGDHAKSIAKVLEKGINTYALNATANSSKIQNNPFFIPAIPGSLQYIKHDWSFISFDVPHDVPCIGFQIHHPECGNVIFATDCSKLNYRFPEANHYLIEANYCAYKLADRRMNGIGNHYVNERVERSHLSIQQAVYFLDCNDLTNVQNIVLIHLSDANSDEGSFRDQIIAATGKPCYIAKKNTTIDLTLF